MRYRHPLITFIYGPADSIKASLAHELEEAFQGRCESVQRIDNFSGHDLPITRWRNPSRVIVTSAEPPSKKLKSQLYEVIQCSERRRPAWLKKLIATRIAERDAKCEPWFDGSAFQRTGLRLAA